MIQTDGRTFRLFTDHTSYIFHVTETGHLEHLYYGTRDKNPENTAPAGERIPQDISLRSPQAAAQNEPDDSPHALQNTAANVPDDSPHALKKTAINEDFSCGAHPRESVFSGEHPVPAGNLISYDSAHPFVTPETMCLEMSSMGKGDIREPFIELILADGSLTCDFLFVQAEILPDKAPYETLPGSHSLLPNDHLCITLKEADSTKAANRCLVQAEPGSTVLHSARNPAGAAPLPSLQKPADTADLHSVRNPTGAAVPHSAQKTTDAAELSAGLFLELHYYVYPEADVICRSTKLVNRTENPVYIRRLMSLQLDLRGSGYVVSAFTGAWAQEMQRTDTPIFAGTYRIESRCGISSHRANPFFMVSCPDTTASKGNSIACNLIYSGNHCETVQANICASACADDPRPSGSPYASAGDTTRILSGSPSASAGGTTRILCGINPADFGRMLYPGESFEAPEAVLTFSAAGHAGISKNMQRFVSDHILPARRKDRRRPVLLNTWEANYFDFNEESLLAQAKIAADIGIELFVLDDGWFGKRNDDTSSLGDWTANIEKLPGGLSDLADKLHILGLSFGLWIEPEMVSMDTPLAKNHPDWIMRIPGRAHSTGRNQYILDLVNPEVTDYLAEMLTRLLSSADIRYVKWDFNRIFSDMYSPYLARVGSRNSDIDANRSSDAKTAFADTAADNLPSTAACVSGDSFSTASDCLRNLCRTVPLIQEETAHRYILGLYRLLKTVTERFPDILFEGCAAGGGRFDLGLLSYFPQIWASDNTDPVCRTQIQKNLSLGYPPCCIGAHVSGSPNHQTGRESTLRQRFQAAKDFSLGYELDLTRLSAEELAEIRAQIREYKIVSSPSGCGSSGSCKTAGTPELP